jgi:type I restriction enzyme R subunit
MRLPSQVAEVLGKHLVMQSTNFEFLRKAKDWAPLSDLGGFAECYARPDPVGAAIKLRSFAEILVFSIYERLNLPKPFRATFHDLLIASAFDATVSRVVLAKLHALRKDSL